MTRAIIWNSFQFVRDAGFVNDTIIISGRIRLASLRQYMLQQQGTICCCGTDFSNVCLCLLTTKPGQSVLWRRYRLKKRTCTNPKQKHLSMLCATATAQEFAAPTMTLWSRTKSRNGSQQRLLQTGHSCLMASDGFLTKPCALPSLGLLIRFIRGQEIAILKTLVL